MTVSYNAEVATCTRFGCFWRLLGRYVNQSKLSCRIYRTNFVPWQLRWRASIYKLIWMDLLVYLGAFYFVAMIYRFILNTEQMRFEVFQIFQQLYVICFFYLFISAFEKLVQYCRTFGSLIPLSFVLGFYVAFVVNRWWDQYMIVPWPDALAVYVSALVRGNDEHGRLMRRTIMRYTCLSLTMVLSLISPGIKRRFPTYTQLVDIGLLVENELQILVRMDEKFPKHPKFWMPIMWASSIVTRARKEGRVWDDFSLKTIIDELNKFRGNCNMLLHYDTISVPLIYTQVVTLAVYAYFLGSIFSHQYIYESDKDMNVVNFYFPLFSTLEFFFFMGWLKVAETLIGPFGDDDDDFELNWVIDRNIQVSYLIVDEMHNDHPELVRDQYWDEVFPSELPYQPDVLREEHPEASTAKLENKTTTITWRDHDEDVEASKIRFRFHNDNTESSIGFAELQETDFTEEEEEGDYESYLGDAFSILRIRRERERVERQIQHTAMTIELFKADLPSRDQTSDNDDRIQDQDNTEETDSQKKKND